LSDDLFSVSFLFEPEPWRENAKCRDMDPDIFFPERGQSVDRAKAACEACVVREECCEFALRTNQKTGIWGGMSHRQRRAWRREQIALKKQVANA